MGNRTEEWLHRTGLEGHVALFAEQRIDHEVLPELTEFSCVIASGS